MKSVNNIDEYIAGFPKTTQVILKQIRALVNKAAPQATEAITYGIPTFKLNGNLVHFGGYENHIGFYPTASGIEAFKSKISKYKWSKGTVQFPLDEPIPSKLITEMVKFRVKAVKTKTKAKKASK